MHATKIDRTPVRGAIACDCGHIIFDGEAIRARCVKPGEGVALCRCKRWVSVPVALRA